MRPMCKISTARPRPIAQPGAAPVGLGAGDRSRARRAGDEDPRRASNGSAGSSPSNDPGPSRRLPLRVVEAPMPAARVCIAGAAYDSNGLRELLSARGTAGGPQQPDPPAASIPSLPCLRAAAISTSALPSPLKVLSAPGLATHRCSLRQAGRQLRCRRRHRRHDRHVVDHDASQEPRAILQQGGARARLRAKRGPHGGSSNRTLHQSLNMGLRAGASKCAGRITPARCRRPSSYRDRAGSPQPGSWRISSGEQGARSPSRRRPGARRRPARRSS